ncbi:MAG: UDP-3-O-acyl-N-acetylglucosamine deacetylase [Phycisphaeraceae bacterium]|nr:UDP-3-O-acyl-N-acetylglucosamine deacetylase [Phycisphaeraceae bacterium]
MTPRPRITLRSEATLCGKGLFTGHEATIVFRPANHGLRMVRQGQAIAVTCENLDSQPIHPAFAGLQARSTNLAARGQRTATVEHALSALSALGVTDCDIELTGPEVPILDGSALPFVRAIEHAGLQPLGTGIEPISINKPIAIEQGNARITATPRDTPGWSISYTLDYGPDAPIAPQSARWDGSPQAYINAIAPARTFCLEHEAIALQQAGLFQGLSPADMLVIGPQGPIENAYRLDNEPAAHKLLDAIGDLALAARPIQADIACHRSGHALNHQMAKALARHA